MSGDTKPASLSPRQRPPHIGIAAVQWAMSRRGRVLVATVVLLAVFLGVAGARHSETISYSYHALSSGHEFPSWNAHGPVSTASPLNPSNTTLNLENGDMEEVPARLTKANPNFHLLMSAVDENIEFCKTTLSAMLLNYPPPTIINLYMEFEDTARLEKARLEAVLRHLGNRKKVKDDDLVLIVDGRDTWFQLPSEVFIQQYQDLLNEANQRTAHIYGSGVSQSILFGAVKTCESDDLACKHFSPSTLPNNAYGTQTGTDVQWTPARYLDSDMLVGAAKDLKKFYEAAIKVFEKKGQQATVHSVMATIFAQQQLARDAQRKDLNAVTLNWIDYFDGSAESWKKAILNTTSGDLDQFEFKLGIDYTHTLFQPLKHCAADELIPLIHDNSTDLSKFHHPGTPHTPLIIPAALHHARPPFWTPDFSAHNPSPNEKPAYIDKLEIHHDLDRLKPRDTTWEQIKLVQNTYTGAVPAIFHVNNRSASKIFLARRRPHKRPAHAITWKSLWYATYERALLRKSFRNPQSPIGYHTAAIGGDRLWDLRGGRGGVWTEREALWLPWGEVDGVCGSVRLMRSAFGDGKGVWLHELDEDKGEKQREEDEAKFREDVLEKQREAIKKEDERLKKEVESVRLEEEQKEREKQELMDRLKQVVDSQKLEEEEQRKKDEEDRIRAEEEERERLKQEKEQKAYEDGQDRLDYENGQENGDARADGRGETEEHEVDGQGNGDPRLEEQVE